MNAKTSLWASAIPLVSVLACGSATQAPDTAPAAQPPEEPAAASKSEPVEVSKGRSAVEKQLALARGGRLFDKWWVEADVEFSPDKKDTEELDGKGGPSENGTLPTAEGTALKNTGHDYRLKNFFGWDLRGAEGIYGEAFHKKSYVLSSNLLTDPAGRDEWVERLSKGYEGLPAYGQVLDLEQIGLIADFILAMRGTDLVAPSAVWELSTKAPKAYVLVEGGDATRGHALIQKQCADCHGADGTDILFDDGEYSLGTFGRAKAYEAWLKVLVGQPGTKMGPQLSPELDAVGQATALKDIFAALCDRSLYPKGDASAQEVKDGDLRCGTLLK